MSEAGALQWRNGRWEVTADSHIVCRADAVPLPCRAAKGLECVIAVWFTQCDLSDSHLPCRAFAVLRPRRSPQGHDTVRPSRDCLWVTCPRSASSGYHAEFHEDYQKHTRVKSGNSTLKKKKKDDLLNCCTSSSDISGYHADFHEGHGTVGAGQGRGMACVN
jgi:hypothetical protein